MPLLRKLPMAILTLTVATSLLGVYGQEIVEDEGCIMKDAECTCAQSASTGDCTRPTEGGNCLQGDCTPSHKCDCFGYELCAITTCGMWTPAVNAILSRTDEFQCKYEADASKCRSATMVMDTVTAADNANSAAVKYVDDVVVDEVDMVKELQEALTSKIRTIDAVRAIPEIANDLPDQVDEEAEEVERIAEEIATESELIAKDLSEASTEATNSFKALIRTRGALRKVDKFEDEAKGIEAEEVKEAKAAKDKGFVCKPCEELKAKVKAIRKERKKAAIEAGTWAKKGRDAKRKGNKSKKSLKDRKKKVTLSTEECVAKTQKILDRLAKK